MITMSQNTSPVWLTTDPPKNMTAFLADVGLPWPVVAAWNGTDECYVYANVQCGMYHAIYNDTYFESEQEKTVTRWMPMPNLP